MTMMIINYYYDDDIMGQCSSREWNQSFKHWNRRPAVWVIIDKCDDSYSHNDADNEVGIKGSVQQAGHETKYLKASWHHMSHVTYVITHM